MDFSARGPGAKELTSLSRFPYLSISLLGLLGCCVEITQEGRCRHLGWGVHGYQNFKLLDSIIWAKGYVTKQKDMSQLSQP